MSKKHILGNWKMHGLRAEAAALAGKIRALPVPAGAHIAVFPPFTALASVAEALKGSSVAFGAQDVSHEAEGAFTGQVSAAMLRDAGCRYVLVGHSERRTLHNETDALVKRKVEAAMRAGLVPVVCVGESLSERESGRHLDVITAQLRHCLPALTHTEGLLIAYEPVWAIGTGKTPTMGEIAEVHKTIASLLSYGTSGARTAIVYGGSVKAATAREILATEGVDGVLVGGASLKAEEFGAIAALA